MLPARIYLNTCVNGRLVYFNSAIDTRGTGTILEEISQTEEISKQLLELIVMISARVELLQQVVGCFVVMW